MATAKKAVKNNTSAVYEKYVWYVMDGDCYVGSSEFSSIAECEKDILDSCEDDCGVIIAKIVKRANVVLQPSLKEIK